MRPRCEGCMRPCCEGCLFFYVCDALPQAHCNAIKEYDGIQELKIKFKEILG